MTEASEPAPFGRRLFIWAGLFALSCSVLVAHTASIQGRITDYSGAVVPDVSEPPG